MNPFLSIGSKQEPRKIPQPWIYLAEGLRKEKKILSAEPLQWPWLPTISETWLASPSTAFSITVFNLSSTLLGFSPMLLLQCLNHNLISNLRLPRLWRIMNSPSSLQLLIPGELSNWKRESVQWIYRYRHYTAMNCTIFFKGRICLIYIDVAATVCIVFLCICVCLGIWMTCICSMSIGGILKAPLSHCMWWILQDLLSSVLHYVDILSKSPLSFSPC